MPPLASRHSNPVRWSWWPHPRCRSSRCLRRCSRSILRRSTCRRRRRLRARVAHLPVFHCHRCSGCHWCSVRAESEALGQRRRRRSHSSEKHAPLQGAERKQLTAGRNFFCTHPPPSPSASPATRRGSESELPFTSKSHHSGFWPRFLDQSSSRSQGCPFRQNKTVCTAPKNVMFIDSNRPPTQVL